ncbi:MAG: CRISPR-associated endonuclease Cas2 [Desulfovibrionaceae bacterium]|nr:CRISPR-associated endonuclease Cas2 [Desulfovibrionaceae bacterium]
MHTIVAYDISDNRTRNKFFKYLKEKGLHSQKSVFECEMDPVDIKSVQFFAASLSLEPQDSVVIYPICKRCSKHAMLLGLGLKFVQTDWMVI